MGGNRGMKGSERVGIVNKFDAKSFDRERRNLIGFIEHACCWVVRRQTLISSVFFVMRFFKQEYSA